MLTRQFIRLPVTTLTQYTISHGRKAGCTKIAQSADSGKHVVRHTAPYRYLLSTVVPSFANSPHSRRNSPPAVGVVAVKRGALGSGAMPSRTCVMSSTASGRRICRSSIASGCLLPPQSRSHPGDPCKALVPPRWVDIVTRLLRVSQAGTHARTRARIAFLSFVLQSDRNKS